MKELSIEQMEVVKGGGCGKAGAVIGVLGGIAAVALLAAPPAAIGVSLVWGLTAAYGTSFSVVGIGCGIAELMTS
ncbi:MAG: hypothetical protein JJU28_08680 [Cyclobacteriaceae bacterium]|nr:hypothetical protein [Cyclobacteriaceae bacterium]